MRQILMGLAIAGISPVWAQAEAPTAPHAPPALLMAPAQDEQRVPGLRQVLLQQQRKADGGHDAAHRQLSTRERAELRETLRRQRVSQAHREEGGKP